MKDILMNIWQNEEGAETAEWLVIVALLVAMASGVYGVGAGQGLWGGLDTLTGYITGQFPGGAVGP
jgi:Flp pilus assembly pilin Flp